MKRVLNKKVLFGLYDDEEILKDAVKQINKEEAEIMDAKRNFAWRAVYDSEPIRVQL